MKWVCLGIVFLGAWVISLGIFSVNIYNAVAQDEPISRPHFNDIVELVGDYCVDGIRMVHYRVKRYNKRTETYHSVSGTYGVPYEFAAHKGYCSGDTKTGIYTK